MIDETRQPATPVTESGTGYRQFAMLMYVIATGFVVWGVRTMYTYQSWGDEGPGRIVQGDAYNYIIIATRGVGWMIAGVVAALFGIAAMLARPARP